MRLFSKMQDFHSKLENILERKIFSANVKNLLLSMIYKIEVSYKDYKEVKRVVKTKKEFIEEFIEIIDKNCDVIKTVEPDSNEALLLKENKVIALTNEKERTALCYPTENALLFAISDIIPKYFYMPDDFVFKESFQNVLVNGFNLNNYEVLSNFNGWSWDITQNSNMKYIDNLIYQNLLFILGDGFLTEWRNHNESDRNFLLEMKDYIKSITGTNSYFYQLCSLLYKMADENKKKKLKKDLKEKIKNTTSKSEAEMYEKILTSETTIEANIIELEKEFLIFLNRKLNNLENREQILNAIYELRYIKNIPIEKGRFISDIQILNNGIDRILKKVVTNACKLGIVKIISMDIGLNYEIIKYALDTKMINLEQIRLNFELQEKEKYLIIKVFDKEVYEKQGRKKIEPSKDLLEVKYNKNIRLFN